MHYRIRTEDVQFCRSGSSCMRLLARALCQVHATSSDMLLTDCCCCLMEVQVLAWMDEKDRSGTSGITPSGSEHRRSIDAAGQDTSVVPASRAIERAAPPWRRDTLWCLIDPFGFGPLAARRELILNSHAHAHALLRTEGQ